MKPVIGVTPQFDVKQNRHWVRPNYLSCLQEAGALPLIFPLTGNAMDISQLAARCDGFLFTGGPDPHPALYGEETQVFCGSIDTRRDTLELMLVREALSRKKPVLGICRGIQLINVGLGGTLWQDIPRQVQTAIQHFQNEPYETMVHRVCVEPGTLLQKVTGKQEFLVNSMHHQAVRRLAPGLVPAARTADGLVEAVCGADGVFLLAVQWHPEYLAAFQPEQRALFSALVEQAEKSGLYDNGYDKEH